jgi:small subunit ribosomal protein S2
MDIDIINLDKTCGLFKDALNVLAHIAFRKGIILFMTRDAASIPLVEKLARESGEYAHCRKWHNGTFTDSIHRFGTVIRYPDLIVFLNTNDSFNEQHKAIREAANMLIPTMGIVDSNTDPNLISYPIPGNDDSISSIELYCNLFKTTILTAKEKRAELEKQGAIVE